MFWSRPSVKFVSPFSGPFSERKCGEFFFGTKTIHEEGGPRGGWQKTILFLGKKKVSEKSWYWKKVSDLVLKKLVS